MSHRGELRRLAEIAEPEVGVVTRVAPVHLEFFASVDEIALAKRELIEGLAGPEPVAVLNADDPRVARFAEVARGRVLTFGCGAQARFSRREDSGPRRGRLRIRPDRPRRAHPASPGACPAATASRTRWRRWPRPASGEIGAERGRGRFPRYARPARCAGGCCEFAAGFAVINDSYNSNPVALAAMIELTRPAERPGYRRRILAAGEMLELGPDSAQSASRGGPRRPPRRSSTGYRGRAGPGRGNRERRDRSAGMPASQARFFADSADAAAFLAEMLQPGDLLLVKGSRGVKMERIVEALRAKYRAGGRSGRRRRRGRDATEMLYYLVYHVPPRRGPPAQRVSLHHRAHGARQPLGAFSGADCWDLG